MAGALPVFIRLLMDTGLLKNEIGMIIRASATINDIIGWSLFAVVLGAFSGTGTNNIFTIIIPLIVFSAILMITARMFGRGIFRWLDKTRGVPGCYIGLVAVIILAASAITESIGVHAVFGAFMVGAAFSIADSEKNQAHDVIRKFAMSFFAPLYFVSIGMKADFVSNFDPLITAVVLIIACAGKILGAGIGARLSGIDFKRSMAIGFGMNARGAMEIILASVALDSGIIDRKVFGRFDDYGHCNITDERTMMKRNICASA